MRPQLLVFVFVVFVTCQVRVTCLEDLSDDLREYEPVEISCPQCKVFNNLTCHLDGWESDGHCKCPICITKCPVADNPCPKGTECIVEGMQCNFPPCTYESAKCVPFNGCKKPKCPGDCNTGYAMDHNDCQTCLCKDPCRELNCKNGQKCMGVSATGEDPTFSCEDVEFKCPTCKLFSNLTCHLMGEESDNRGCSCPVCLTFCPVEDNPCQKGEECIMEITQCNLAEGLCGVPTAKCVPFTGCKPLNCSSSARCRYGYLKDHNECDTCLCSQQCKELGCTKCIVTKSPGRDKTYSCID